MSVQNKRAGTLRVLTCRICNKQFARRKVQAVCCHACHLIYKEDKIKSLADLEGAISNDNTNQTCC